MYSISKQPSEDHFGQTLNRILGQLGKNGFELYRELRFVDDKIKVCFITAFEEYHNEFNKLFPNSKEGVKHIIRKPVELGVLTKIVETQLQRN